MENNIIDGYTVELPNANKFNMLMREENGLKLVAVTSLKEGLQPLSFRSWNLKALWPPVVGATAKEVAPIYFLGDNRKFLSVRQLKEFSALPYPEEE